jgi:hypothetical protein
MRVPELYITQLPLISPVPDGSKGIGQYGIKLSSFCGPLFVPEDGDSSRIPVLRFAFTMDELHVNLPILRDRSRVSIPYSVDPEGDYVSFPWSTDMANIFGDLGDHYGSPIVDSLAIGRFDRELRTISFLFDKKKIPLIVSARTCDFEPRPRPAPHPIEWLEGAAKIAKTPLTIRGVYCSKIKGIFSVFGINEYPVSLSFSPNGFTIGYRASASKAVPVSIDGSIVEFDSTDENYQIFLNYFKFKKWPNHLITYLQSIDQIQLFIGWNTYVFSKCSDPSQSLEEDWIEIESPTTSTTVVPRAITAPQRHVDVCRAPRGKFCSNSLTDLSLVFPDTPKWDGSVHLQFKTGIFQWFTAPYNYVLTYKYSGTNVALDGKAPGISALSSALGNSNGLDYVHCVHDCRTNKITLTLGDRIVSFLEC